MSSAHRFAITPSAHFIRYDDASATLSFLPNMPFTFHDVCYLSASISRFKIRYGRAYGAVPYAYQGLSASFSGRHTMLASSFVYTILEKGHIDFWLAGVSSYTYLKWWYRWYISYNISYIALISMIRSCQWAAVMISLSTTLFIEDTFIIAALCRHYI